MTNLDNIDDTRLIIDGVNNPIASLTNTVEVYPSSQLFRS